MNQKDSTIHKHKNLNKCEKTPSEVKWRGGGVGGGWCFVLFRGL